MSYIEICECGCTKEGHFDKKGACLTRGCDSCKQYRDRSRPKNVSAGDELRKVLPDHKIESPAESRVVNLYIADSSECGVAFGSTPTAAQRCYDKPGHDGVHRSRGGLIWRDLDSIKLDITIGDTVTVNGKSISHPSHTSADSTEDPLTWLDGINLDNRRSFSHPTLEEFVGAADGMKAAIDKAMSPPATTIAEAVAKLEAANPGDKIPLADSVYDAMSSTAATRPSVHAALFPEETLAKCRRIIARAMCERPFPLPANAVNADHVTYALADAISTRAIYASARVLEKTCEVPYAVHARSCECDDCEEYNVDDPTRLAQAKVAAEHEAHAFAGIDLASNDDESALVIARQDATGSRLGAVRIIEEFKCSDPDRIAKAFRDSVMAWSAALRKDPLKQE